MSDTGKVVNGMVVLAPGIRLPEGAAANAERLGQTTYVDSLLAVVEKLGKRRPYLHRNCTLNQSHDFCGLPKK
jgi:hypothetical protein